MPTTIVSSGNILVSRLISGVVALSLDHPIAMCVILATLAGASLAVLLDVIGDYLEAKHVGREESDRPIRGRS